MSRFPVTPRCWLCTVALVLALASPLPATPPELQRPEKSADEVADEAVSSEDLGRFVRWVNGPISVLLTDAEIEVLRRIRTSTEAESFVGWFWLRRDPTPESAANEFKEDFQVRMGEVEKRWSRGERPGWRTAPGLVQLIFGPPAFTKTLEHGLVGADGVLDTVVWAYPEHGLVLPFVETADGLKLATTRPGSDFSLQRVMREIEDAKRGLVTRPDLPFGAPVPGLEQAGALPLQAVVHASQDGLRVGLRLPLKEVMGASSGGEVVLRYRIGFAGVEEPLGVVTVSLSKQELVEWVHHDLHIALWLPRDVGPEGSARRLVVEEERSRRREIVPLVAGAGASFQEDEIAKGVWVEKLAGGEGAAVAYLRPCDRSHANVVGWVVPLRVSGDDDGDLGGVLPGVGLGVRDAGVDAVTVGQGGR